MDEMPIDNSIVFHITSNQAEMLANHFGVNLDELEEYEICELLDNYIDELN